MKLPYTVTFLHLFCTLPAIEHEATIVILSISSNNDSLADGAVTL